MADRDISLRIAVRDVDQAVQKLRQFGTQGDRALASISRSAQASTGPLQSVRKNIGGIGLQAQDVAVQLQTGTNPLTILAQQGSQVASLFGPGGAVAGALLAFGAIAASSLFSFASAAEDTFDAIKTLDGALDDAGSTAESYAERLSTATEEQRKFAATLAELSNVQLQSQAAALLGGIDLDALFQSSDQFRQITGAPEGPGPSAGSRRALEIVGATAEFKANLSGLLRTAVESGQPEDVLRIARENGLFTASSAGAIEELAQIARRIQLNDLIADLDTEGLERVAAESGSGRARAQKSSRATAEERAIERQAKARQDLLATVSIQVEQSARLLEAERQGEAAVKALNAALEIENELRRVGLSQNDPLGRQISEEIQARQGLQDEIEATIATREREKRALQNSQLAPEFNPLKTLATPEQLLASASADSQSQRQQAEEFASVLTSPLEASIQDLQSLSAETIEGIRKGTLGSAEELAGRIGDIFASVPEQALATAITGPLQQFQAQISKQLVADITNGGLDFEKLAESFNNPLGAASLGAFGGGLLAQATGGNQQFGSLGGALGAGVGQAFGGPLGGILGGIGGSLIGGAFGGGQSNNRANATVDLRTGRVTQDNSPGLDDPNRQAVIRLSEEINAFSAVASSLGIGVGRSSLSLQVSRNRGAAESEQIVASQLAASLEAESPIIARAIANSTARSLDDLLGDIQFAQSIQDLVDGTGEFEKALRELNRQFEESSQRATSLGISERLVQQARQDAIDDLLVSAEDSLLSAQDRLRSAFESQLSPITGALDAIQFGPSTALNAEARLGILQGQFAEQQQLLESGQLQDTTALAQTAQQLVATGREVFGSSGGFQDIFRETNAALLSAQSDITARQEQAFADVGGEIVRSQEAQTDRLVDELRELREDFDRLRRAIA